MFGFYELFQCFHGRHGLFRQRAPNQRRDRMDHQAVAIFSPIRRSEAET